MKERPPFIFAYYADNQGCGYHRIMLPLAGLIESGACEGRSESMPWPDEAIIAASPDVIIWQRYIEDTQVETIKRYRKLLPDALFIYELDDYLDEIPELSFHASFMPPDISARVAKGMAECERVTTTTEPMAEWLRSLGAKDVRVVPNLIAQSFFKEREPRIHGKVRVGWAGGMSHDGDLENLRHAMETIGDDVTWVFMGAQPDNPPCRVEFHEGVGVVSYLDVMSKLDIDLMLAPLEDNQFNRCKSNLRLLETGAIGAAVIAQDIPPYRYDDPPVFAYVTKPEEWTKAIQQFVALSPVARKRQADLLKAWVARKYTLEKRLAERMEAWLPEGPKWKPVAALDQKDRPIVSAHDFPDVVVRMPFLRWQPSCQDGLEEACRKSLVMGSHVLWMRPGSVMTEAGWRVLNACMATSREIASVIPLASDGVNSFPHLNQWTLLGFDRVKLLDSILQMELRGRQLLVTAPIGPVALLSRSAIAMLGIPDVKGNENNEEYALIEWSLRALSRKWRHIQVASAFAESVVQPAQPTQKTLMRMHTRNYNQLLQLEPEKLTAEERETVELRLWNGDWGGPRPGINGFGIDYEAWRLFREIQIGVPPHTEGLVEVLPFGEQPKGKAEWVIYVDDQLTLKSAALAWFNHAAESIDKHSSVSVIYADHENQYPDGKRAPEFKPDFDYELLLGQDYISPLCAIHVEALSGAPEDRTELFGIILDIAIGHKAKGFYHIPHVLGTLTADPTPEKLAIEALNHQLDIRDRLGETINITAHRHLLGCLVTQHRWETQIYPGYIPNLPLISIVIPTLGGGRQIQPCVATVLQHTKYPNYEILVVQNGERQEPELIETTRVNEHIRVVRYEEPGVFNWSKINNWAIRCHARGEFIVALNDDVCVATKPKHWLDVMLGAAMQPDVGVVGARLLHPHGTVQHCGVICHRSIAGHMHKTLANGHPGHMGRAILSHEATAVTGACMLFSRELFNRLGGFDETLEQNYGDTLFCLKARELGLRNVVEMTAELLHSEGTSRNPQGFTVEALKRLVEDNRAIAKQCDKDDPYWTPNLSIALAQGGAAIQGLNADMFDWHDFRPKPGAERVLVVNDAPGARGLSLPILTDDDVPYHIDLSGFRLKFVSPTSLNIQPMDIRQPERLIRILQLLDIRRIVICSFVGADEPSAPIEALHLFDSLRAKFRVELTSKETNELTPWMDSEAEAKARQTFGPVDLALWETIHRRLTTIKEAAE